MGRPGQIPLDLAAGIGVAGHDADHPVFVVAERDFQRMVLPRPVDGEGEVAQADRGLARRLHLDDVEDDPGLVGPIAVISDRAACEDGRVPGDERIDGRLTGDGVEHAAAQVAP